MDKLLKKSNLSFVFEVSYSLIILIGIMGNATNVLVLSRKTMRKSLTFQLYLYLSIIDLTFLTQTGVELFLKYSFGIEMRELSVVFCKLNTFLSYFLMQTRNIFSMSITLSYVLELSKLNPKQNKEKNESILNKIFNFQTKTSSKTPKKSPKFIIKIRRILLFTLFILGMINFHFILFLSINLNVEANFEKEKVRVLEELVQYDTKMLDENMNKETHIIIHAECSPYNHEFYVHFLRNIWVWIDMIIYFLIPFTVNLTSFLFIFVYIKRLNNRYTHLLHIENYKPNAHIFLKRMRKNRRIVWRLFSLNSYFFFSSLPSYVSYYSLIWTRTHLFINYLCYIFFYSNNALNFLFYGLTSEKYRIELMKILGVKEASIFHVNIFNSLKKLPAEKTAKDQLKKIDSLKSKCEKFEKLLIEKDKEIFELIHLLGQSEKNQTKRFSQKLKQKSNEKSQCQTQSVAHLDKNGMSNISKRMEDIIYFNYKNFDEIISVNDLFIPHDSTESSKIKESKRTEKILKISKAPTIIYENKTETQSKL